MANIINKRFIIPVLILFAIVFPFVTQNDYFIHVMTLSFIWMIGVYGLNLLAGYTGYLSLAHAGFFAVGAYSLGLLTVKAQMNFWLAFVLSLIITSVLGFLIGLIALRTKEHFFAIYTLCVGYILYLIIDKWDSLTEGVRGLIGIPAPGNIGPISFETPLSQYYLVLAILLVVILIVYRIVHSLTGRTYIAIRNSEDLALTIGISTMKNKLEVFVLSTFFAGLSGALYASFIRFIGPDIGNIVITFDLLTYLLIGGIGTLSGPIVGTVLVVWISQQLQFLQDYRMLIFGPILTLLVIFYPRGIAGSIAGWNAKRAEKKLAKAQQDERFSQSPISAENQVKEG
ncbi:branched-chain amino acid ABC transporter permease [Mesobacillus selenatarsenatis]|uniref:Branched-chain amino acid transport system permease protein LivM n=1 Tax=Mesobacillus selenatarsenatis (strain DSM 18680 / JCM 14380 / FERM P-15431 / SF-1) TaxID=1321606 RepID=A0A0A8X293_MESS1|nr:branched-chain amino acid ABC transporter permease [Mesobacillus selenatarsenatis]GAM13354.1 branched-chain amino acid transport system permease protein LivM [Mesobacillus selenatarsenatis SF-1]